MHLLKHNLDNFVGWARHPFAQYCMAKMEKNTGDKTNIWNRESIHKKLEFNLFVDG